MNQLAASVTEAPGQDASPTPRVWLVTGYRAGERSQIIALGEANYISHQLLAGVVAGMGLARKDDLHRLIGLWLNHLLSEVFYLKVFL